MAKHSRNIYQPITASDWFLYHLFNDKDFIEIRKQCQSEINDIDQEAGQEARQLAEIEEITTRYVEPLRQKFGINEVTARKGLLYKEHNRTLNGDRVPVAEIRGDRVIISIGANTTLKDVEDLWTPWISLLQSKLPNYNAQRETPSDEPLLAYTVYKELRNGRKMTEIHRAYSKGTLHSEIPEGNKWPEVSDFRKYYKEIVKGYLDRP